MNRNRGQLVVLAALAIAVALVPMALAYLQLGYHADVHSGTVGPAPLAGAERTLDRALDDAATDVPPQHPWTSRSAAVTAIRERLEPTIRILSASRLADGTVIEVSYNDSLARAWVRDHCPSGPARDFGPCRTERAVVVQKRAGRTHVLAVAVDVRVTRPDGTARTATVVTAPSAPPLRS